MPSLLDIALKYAARGLRVFALEVLSKRPPRGSRGVSEASHEEEVIRELWRRAGPDAGIGLVPGPGYWVLDVDTDPPKAHLDGWTGLQAIEALREGGLILPPTKTARTPRGGLHLWWLADGVELRPRSQGVLVSGTWAALDIRAGLGSYVVAPPSRVAIDKGPLAGQVGSYEWIDRRDAVAAPAWLLELLTPPQAPREVQPARPYQGQGVRGERYALRVLDTACRACSDTAPGAHARWLSRARLMGGYVSGGYLARAEVEDALVRAAMVSRQGRDREIRRTIAQGLDLGEAAPVTIPEKNHG